MSYPRLEITAGPDVGKHFVILSGSGNFLGRHNDARYTLADPRVSRFHCEIRSDGDSVTLNDNGGSGGVLINGVKVDKAILKPGDKIHIGDTSLRFVTHESADVTLVGPVRQKLADLDTDAIEELSELSGRTLAHYELGEVIGRGKSSMVFKAIDTENGTKVALKVMRPELSQDNEEKQRFVRAMKTMLPLRHPNLVSLYSAGKSGPYLWAAMELIEGESLTAVIDRIGIAGMLDWKVAFKVATQIGRALEYAHGKGVIHRNVAPPNIIIRASDNQAVLGDLLLAKALEGALAKQVTKPGELVGDVDYMSPERTRGIASEVDERSDLFGLGASVYALLAGRPPFAATTLVETLTKIRTATPAALSTFQIGIPHTFEGVVLKLLAKRPEERYQSAADVVKELERIGKFNRVEA